MILTILWFLLLLSFLVVIHELGHFFAAKSVKVHVLEFGVGYPPKAVTLFRWLQTPFTLNWLPLGGFVRLFGDDAGEDFGAESSLPEGVTEENQFHRKSARARLWIIVAGVISNFVFGVLVFAVLYSKFGIPEKLGYIKIQEVVADSPAQRAGFQEGDEVVRVKSSDGEESVVKEAAAFSQLMNARSGETVQFFVRRNGENITLTAELRPADRPADQAALGVVPQDMEMRFYAWWQQPFRGMWAGLQDSVLFGRLILQSLGSMVGRLVSKGEIPQDISGPIGIVAQAQEADILKQGWVGTVRYAGLLSINLAIMNLLPIPALDGGRGVFVLLERFIGKDRRMRWERIANSYGMIFLLGLILLISIQDVLKIVR